MGSGYLVLSIEFYACNLAALHLKFLIRKEWGTLMLDNESVSIGFASSAIESVLVPTHCRRSNTVSSFSLGSHILR